MRPSTLLLIALLASPAVSAAITLGQLDDFEDATLQGWGSGAANPTPPVNAADQGPAGAGDRALVATASGTSGAGSRLVIFNTAQWTGDYLAAGVNAIGFDVANLSDRNLAIRAVLRGPGNTFATAQAAILPGGDSAYRRVALSLLPEDLELVDFGMGDVMATLGGVTELRIQHSAFPARIGDVINAQVALDNVTALADTLDCATGLPAKADSPSDFLLLPGFEVDTSNPNALTTFITAHNQTDEPRVARFQYFDSESNLQRSEDHMLAARDTASFNIRTIPGLSADPDGVIRGWAQVLACVERGGELDGSFTGDYLFLDRNGNFATGDQLLRAEDLCTNLQVRLLNFGSGVTLRLFVTDPQGDAGPTATFTVWDEDGNVVDTGALILDQNQFIFDSALLSSAPFGTLDVDLLAGAGALTVEYSAFGLFSVSMNANCVDPPLVLE